VVGQLRLRSVQGLPGPASRVMFMEKDATGFVCSGPPIRKPKTSNERANACAFFSQATYLTCQGQRDHKFPNQIRFKIGGEFAYPLSSAPRIPVCFSKEGLSSKKR